MYDLPHSASAVNDNREKYKKKTLENMNGSLSVSQVTKINMGGICFY
jgi:hypothetical protein